MSLMTLLFAPGDPTPPPGLDPTIPDLGPALNEIGTTIAEQIPYVDRTITTLNEWATDFWPRLYSDPPRFWFSVGFGIFVLLAALLTEKMWAMFLSLIGGFWIGWLIYNQWAEQPLTLFPGQGNLLELFSRATESAQTGVFAGLVLLVAIGLAILVLIKTNKSADKPEGAAAKAISNTSRLVRFTARVFAVVSTFAAVLLVADFVNSIATAIFSG